MRRLEGRVAIITGAGQGCGLGVAQVFASEGANLVITGRVAAKLEGVKGELEARGAKVVICAGDAARRENAQAAVQAAIDAFGRLDVLVNNAQASVTVPIEDLTDEALELTFGSGYKATLYFMQAALPHLKARGGSIINFGSKHGLRPDVGVAAYSSTKEAIRALSRVAAKEWGQYKIRVNVVNPAALSPGAELWGKQNPGELARHLKDSPLGYFGDAEIDVGRAILFLALDDSRYVTGQTINIDGGQVMM